MANGFENFYLESEKKTQLNNTGAKEEIKTAIKDDLESHCNDQNGFILMGYGQSYLKDISKRVRIHGYAFTKY